MCSRLNSFCQKFGQLALALLGTVGIWDYRASYKLHDTSVKPVLLLQERKMSPKYLVFTF